MNDKLENAYYNIENFVLEHCSTDEWNEFAEYIQLVQKAVKALKVIKEKKVDVRFLLQCKSLKEYNYIYKGTSESNLQLTKEEYDLLKEVLKNG